ncbi:MAG: putative nucleic-acid-binding protein contains domain [Caulobacteraceae bacterium]|jgi:predicted nucleic acid-binding protein|nr:putative nucleic-acid-binding protein contains domain [Caulobacteraceae bacterium]
MSAEPFSLDTNILVYALDSAAGARHTLAAEIIARAATCDCRLTLQSLSEFYVVVTRKGIVPKTEAAAQVEDWLLLFPTLAPTPAAVRAALGHASAGRASYWDALLVATAGEGGCEIVLSEDMAGGGRLGSVTVFNPFDGVALTDRVERLLVA